MGPGTRRDLLVALAGASYGAVAAALTGLSPAVTVAAGVAGAALGLVRRLPTLAWATAAAMLFATAAGGGLLEAPFVLVAVHAFCAGRWAGSRSGIAGAVALVAAAIVTATAIDESGVPFLLLIGAPWAAGRALREREHVAAQLAQRARELEEEREAHAALSVRYERARIASELHDIVAHAISVMVVQASAGQRIAADDPAAAGETFEAIADAARQAEQDMERLVALLGGEDAIGAAPDLALVEELVSRAAGSGLDVTLRLEGEREGLPAELVETAYRIVQEGLTNALRYASGAPVSVRVDGAQDALVIAVENGPAAQENRLAGAGTGNGLRGLRERVGAFGGRLEAGPTAQGGWRLGARLPRRIAARIG